ncbi:hypothetical protein TREES_T100009867 [Tupaia chinensis]|uniref:Uncharacterized protein n=1 Tax=Tupaia chinensis TaxID=246437 RepID=L9KP03_TUPCH|nr:hypothetical protein TREES_T100009867 [Tupaia chinensis]
MIPANRDKPSPPASFTTTEELTNGSCTTNCLGGTSGHLRQATSTSPCYCHCYHGGMPFNCKGTSQEHRVPMAIHKPPRLGHHCCHQQGKAAAIRGYPCYHRGAGPDCMSGHPGQAYTAITTPEPPTDQGLFHPAEPPPLTPAAMLVGTEGGISVGKDNDSMYKSTPESQEYMTSLDHPPPQTSRGTDLS